MSNLPFMKLFWPEFLADTSHLSCDELGLYVRILGRMWLSPEGHISQEMINRLCHQASLKPGLEETDAAILWQLNAKCVCDMLDREKNGMWTQKRLLEEHKTARETRAKLAEAGRKGGSSQAQARLKPKASRASQLKQDIYKTPITPLKNGTKPKPKTNGSAKSLVDLSEWHPDKQDRAYAQDRGLEADRILEDIRDWVANAAPDKAKKRDPRRFWQGWCRREADKRGGVVEARDANDRPLTFDEQRSYERAFRPPPRTTNKPPGEWAGLGNGQG